MLRSIIEFSLRFRLAVVVGAVAILGVGGAHLRSTPVDSLPEFTPPYVEIQTEAPGLSADEVEQLVTVPLEADLLNGVQGASAIRSQSLPGLSSVVLVFEPGTDVYRGRQLVQERLTQLGAAALPMISKPPTLLPPLSSSSRVLMIGLSSPELTPIEQSVIARWTVKPRVMGVPGVANVAIWGMRDQQLQVQVDPERLQQEGVTLQQVIETAGNAQVFSPLSYLEASTPGTGGFVETPQQRLQVRNVLETIADPGALAQVPVDDTDGQLLLGDVADVKVDHQPLIGDAVLDNGPGLLLVVEKYPGADPAEVTRGVEAALNQLRPGLAGIQTETSVFRPANYLDEAIGNVSTAVAVAAVLLLLALAAFLFEWRAIVVTAVAVPVALVTALVVIDALGETINAITLAGLALAMVVVVDDAIAGAEAVARAVRSGGQHGDGRLLGIVRDASRAVRSPLSYALLVALLAILPVVVIQGLAGDFFAPLAVSYCVAVLAATAVALTVTPALSMLLLSSGEQRHREPPAARLLQPPYRRAMHWFLARRAVLPVTLGVVAVAGFGTLLLLDTTVVPTFKDRQVVVRLKGDPGMSNPRMTEIANTVVADLRSVAGVEDVAAHVGRAVTGDQIVDVSSSEVWVSMEAGADYDATLSAIDTSVDRAADVSHEVTTYTSQRISDVGALESDGPSSAARDGVDVLTGVASPLVVRVYGQDPDVLMDQAGQVQRIMSEVDGVVDPTIDGPMTQPTVEIEVDLARARRYGIKPGDVRRAETTLLQGILVGSVFQRQKVFDVVVVGVPGTRSSVAAVRNLLIDAPDGGHVRLGQVADVRVGETPTVINRDAVSRRIDVLAGVNGRDVSAVASDIENRLAAGSFPLEYHADVLQRSTGSEIGTTRIAAVAIAVLIAAYLVFQAAFQSWRLAFLAFATLPLVLTGGLVAALINGAELSLGCLIGLGALLVLGVRNAMLGIRSLRGHDPDGPAGASTWSAVRGGESRLMPVLTTMAALAAVALPFAVMDDRGGLEIASPMAIVLLGGLVTSTFIALVGLPGLYSVFSREGDSAEAPPTGKADSRGLGADDALPHAGPAAAADLSTDGEGSS